MRFVCDAAGGKAWFRIETEAEAARESELMRHAVEKHFRRAQEQASQCYWPAPGPFVEQDIGREAHIRRTMPVFLTLRDGEGNALATAMLPPRRLQAAGRYEVDRLSSTAARGCGIRSWISRRSIRRSRTMVSKTPAATQRWVCW